MSAADLLGQLRERVDFALINVPSFDAANADKPSRALDLRLAELSAEFTMQTFGVPLSAVHFADSYDAALAAGTRDFCLIQRFGHLFHGPHEAVAAALLETLDGCAFLTGHIMERGGYYYMHDQCVLVNRRAWERLGKPTFGAPASGPQRASVPKRSPGDVHDDYTPLFLDPTGEERTWEGAFGYGWQAISDSLRAGIRVTNWDEAPRRYKRNCYAYYGHPTEWQRALGDTPLAPPTTDDGLQGIVQFLNGVTSRMPIRDPATALQDAVMLDVPQARFREGIDTIVAPAGGFDMHRALVQLGFHDRTAVTFYGTESDLAVQRERIEQWDGRNLAELEFNFRRFIAVTCGSEVAWGEHWARVRRLDIRYVATDPVVDPNSFAALSGDGTAAVLLGTTFNSFATLARFDGAHRRKAYDIILAALKQRTARYIVLGQPPYQRIRGI